MANVIAEIRLAPGEVGYYDDYSRVYLNASRPTAKIYSDMNTTQIRRSIRSGRLRLISGSLNATASKAENPAPKEKADKKQKAAPEKVVKEPEPIVAPEPEPVIAEEKPTVEAEPVIEAEPVVEQVIAEPVQEEAPVKPKRRSRKKQAEEPEVVAE